MTKLTHSSFLCSYFSSLHVKSNLVLIIRRINCINTASGICHSVSVTVSWWERKVPFRPRKELSFPTTKRSPTQNDIYQRLCWYNLFSWWWARGCSKHVENWNKYIEKNCTSSWSFTKNHNKMHGQQNIKYFIGDISYWGTSWCVQVFCFCYGREVLENSADCWCNLCGETSWKRSRGRLTRYEDNIRTYWGSGPFGCDAMVMGQGLWFWQWRTSIFCLDEVRPRRHWNWHWLIWRRGCVKAVEGLDHSVCDAALLNISTLWRYGQSTFYRRTVHCSFSSQKAFIRRYIAWHLRRWGEQLHRRTVQLGIAWSVYRLRY